MSVPARHLVHQTSGIWSTISLATAKRSQVAPALPGPSLTGRVGPRSPAMVRDYLRFVGGSAKAWRGQLPPHLFPQWGWPIFTQALRGIPYDLKSVVNAGCAWQLHAPIPDDETLELSCRLTDIDDDGRRALISLELVTGTASTPQALTATLTAYVPLPKKKDAEGNAAPRKKKARPQVPLDARPIRDRRLRADAGRDFAILTGDPNPIHWLRPYARAAGFKGCILHGFAQAAIACEALIAGPFCGDVGRLRSFEARFTRPLVIPGRVQVYTRDHEIYLGAAPGGPANLIGEYGHG